jgi:membrane protein DedA with SNARE-associated domain
MSPTFSAYIIHYGYIAIFSLVFLQEIGVPNPVPNELVLLFSGYLISVGKLDLTLVWLTAACADIIASSLLYMTFYYFGQRLLQKWPHVIAASTLDSFTTRIAYQDRWGIYVGRLMPFIRGYAAVAAGLLKISPGIFLPAVLVTALAWSGGYVIAGKLLGQEYAKVISKLGLGKVVLAGIAFLCLLGFLGPRLYHSLKSKGRRPSGWLYARDDARNSRE